MQKSVHLTQLMAADKPGEWVLKRDGPTGGRADVRVNKVKKVTSYIYHTNRKLLSKVWYYEYRTTGVTMTYEHNYQIWQQ